MEVITPPENVFFGRGDDVILEEMKNESSNFLGLIFYQMHKLGLENYGKIAVTEERYFKTRYSFRSVFEGAEKLIEQKCVVFSHK